ncbi:MAG TPA: GNAT family N-acetyltransferase, partial [Blastocatellia bacterium]|nr:GNAT family N-acetyltransferase [Blastocatellia bacterium]
ELNTAAIGFGGIDKDAVEQIRYVYVIPEYQGSDLRLGSRILETLEEVARQVGIRLIRLHSTPNAVGFYEKAGYSAVRVEDIAGHDHPGVEMAKDLAGS